jgi:hypothetical protein
MTLKYWATAYNCNSIYERKTYSSLVLKFLTKHETRKLESIQE